jgi:nitrogen fixation/metabolism regulation signal transduction histidine kinase
VANDVGRMTLTTCTLKGYTETRDVTSGQIHISEDFRYRCTYHWSGISGGGGGQMRARTHRMFSIFAPKVSLRHRVAFSLAIVRLILAPVILLAIYYLFEMGWIVDRIVNVDAPAATLAQAASIQLLEARRAEHNFLLLYDANDVKENHDSMAAVTGTLAHIQDLQPEERGIVQNAMNAVNLYEERFAAAVSYFSSGGEVQRDRIETVVRNYESDLNDLVRKNKRKTKVALVDEIRTQVGSFDALIMSTLQSDPRLRQMAADLDASSQDVFSQTSALEAKNWQRVEEDHRATRRLLKRAEWVLSIVSALTIILSIWISFVLPRQVVKPLQSLKEAVDHALSGNQLIEFELQGKGEIVELAKSIHRLIARFGSAGHTA